MDPIIIEEVKPLTPPPVVEVSAVPSLVQVVVRDGPSTPPTSVSPPPVVPAPPEVAGSEDAVVPVTLDQAGVPAGGGSQLPVSSLYFSTSDENPSLTLGYGRWSLISNGNPIFVG